MQSKSTFRPFGRMLFTYRTPEMQAHERYVGVVVAVDGTRYSMEGIRYLAYATGMCSFVDRPLHRANIVDVVDVSDPRVCFEAA